MTRSRWKGPFCAMATPQREVMSRGSTILPQWIGWEVRVHRGDRFVPLRITEEMVGHRFGEFASTRRPPRHPTRK